MKKSIIYSALAATMLVTGAIKAQTKAGTKTAVKTEVKPVESAKPAEPVKKQYPEPSTQEKVYLYNEEENEAEDLQTAELTSDDRSTGFKTKEYYYTTPGEKCQLRIKKKQKVCFLVMFYDAKFDPMQNYKLMKMNINVKKKRRECVINKTNEWTGSSNTDFKYIPFSQKKVVDKTKDDGVVRMLTAENLEPGEYVWTNGWGDGPAWFFGIDE